MIPAAFDYVRPADIGEALTILKEREGDAKLLAGGISLLSLLKLRLAQPSLLVDLRDVAGLDGIDVGGESVRIGARTTHRQILEHDALAAALPIMRDAAGGIGDPQIRNWGTIGGSIAHADPSADWPAVLIAVGASLTLRSASRERVVPARSFFVDTFTTDIDPTEILTEILIPFATTRAGGAYQQLERRAGDFSTVGAAVQLRLGEDRRVASIGIGLTAVGDAPFAATNAEDALRGAQPDDAMFRKTAAAAAAQSRPADDSHGPADYKRAMVAEMTFRALSAARDRAGAA